MEVARPHLREAFRRALRDTIERTPGNRAAALRRARNEILQVLSSTKQPEGEHVVKDAALRSMLTIELEAAVADLLRDLAGRS
jgi:hypothetical protein